MTKEEYNKKMRSIEENAEKEIDAVRVQYARANNPIKIGDVITDHFSQVTIRVESITFRCSGYRYPYCMYSGTRLTKKGTPFKSAQLRKVPQPNVETLYKKYLEGEE
jgi:hypothetical protein